MTEKNHVCTVYPIESGSGGQIWGQSAGCVLESSCWHAMGNSFGSDVPSEARCVDTAFCFAN